MKCLRCGYCCIELLVILPDGKPKMSGEQCPYLKWDGDIAVCTIHGQEFELDGYKFGWEETPCGRHDQISKSPNDECRMGAHLRKKGLTGKAFLK